MTAPLTAVVLALACTPSPGSPTHPARAPCNWFARVYSFELARHTRANALDLVDLRPGGLWTPRTARAHGPFWVDCPSSHAAIGSRLIYYAGHQPVGSRRGAHDGARSSQEARPSQTASNESTRCPPQRPPPPTAHPTTTDSTVALGSRTRPARKHRCAHLVAD